MNRQYTTMSGEKVALGAGMNMPMRQASASSARSDDAVPTTDPNDVSSTRTFCMFIFSNSIAQTSSLLAERLQAWKHACGYLEEYIGATMKAQAAHSKEYEKVLKVSKCDDREGQLY